jgi:hypothetical protein
MVGRCAWIDGSVKAVKHMRGGSQEGYSRWEAFRAKRLDLYAAHRNNAMKRRAVKAPEMRQFSSRVRCRQLSYVMLHSAVLTGLSACAGMA